MGMAQIVMPENYIAMFNAPQAEEAQQIVAKAEPDIDRAVSVISANHAFLSPRHNLYGRFMSGPVNQIFYLFFVKTRVFTAGDTCTGCGQCARLCPTNNITIQNGRPVWGDDCTHCMMCTAAAQRKPSSTVKSASVSPDIILRRFESFYAAASRLSSSESHDRIQ